MNNEGMKQLGDVRDAIDDIDHQIVRLIASRQAQVERAGGIKGSVAEVPAPERVEAVIRKVRAIAVDSGADPDLIEAVYRTMITSFIERELEQVKRRDETG